jgi:hypothetical protein
MHPLFKRGTGESARQVSVSGHSHPRSKGESEKIGRHAPACPVHMEGTLFMCACLLHQCKNDRLVTRPGEENS